MNPSIILDAHLDIALNKIALGRDFRKSSWEKQRLERKFPGHPYDNIGVATVGMPDLMLGRVGVVFSTLWVSPPGQPACEAVYYYDAQDAYRQGMLQMDYYHRLADEEPRVRLIYTQKDLDAVLATWQDGKTLNDHVIGFVVLMEGADPILEPKQLEAWYARGLRIIGPAWNKTRYAYGTDEPGRLTSLGRELLEVMAGFRMLLDLSHLAEQAFFEALDSYDGAVVASHSNPRHFVDGYRHLSDDMIRRLIERDGVMGIVPFNQFMKKGWKSGREPKTDVTVKTMLDMIDHVCQLAGNANHVGIGTDWDGFFGWESIPVPFDSHIDLWKIRGWLAQHGYSSDSIDRICCGNFLRKLRESLPA